MVRDFKGIFALLMVLTLVLVSAGVARAAMEPTRAAGQPCVDETVLGSTLSIDNGTGTYDKAYTASNNIELIPLQAFEVKFTLQNVMTVADGHRARRTLPSSTSRTLVPSAQVTPWPFPWTAGPPPRRQGVSIMSR